MGDQPEVPSSFSLPSQRVEDANGTGWHSALGKKPPLVPLRRSVAAASAAAVLELPAAPDPIAEAASALMNGSGDGHSEPEAEAPPATPPPQAEATSPPPAPKKKQASKEQQLEEAPQEEANGVAVDKGDASEKLAEAVREVKTKRKPPRITKDKMGTNHRNAVLTEQCSNAPQAQLSRATAAAREDELECYSQAIKEMAVLRVAQGDSSTAKEAFDDAQHSLSMFTMCANTGVVVREIANRVIIDYFGDMAAYNRGSTDSAHNGAGDFFVAGKAVAGVPRVAFTPLEQEELFRLRNLESELTSVGRTTAFAARTEEPAPALSKAEEAAKRAVNNREKARIFLLQAEVLTGEWAAKLVQEKSSGLLDELIPQMQLKDEDGCLDKMMRDDLRTVYNLRMQCDAERSVCEHRVESEALQNKRRADEGQPPIVVVNRRGAKKRRAREHEEQLWGESDRFTVAGASTRGRTKKLPQLQVQE